MSSHKYIMLAFGLLLSKNVISQSAVFDLVQPLDFGQIVVIRNDQVGTYSVNKRGLYDHTPEFGVIVPGQHGIYRISNLTPFELKTFNVVEIATEMNTPGGYTETFGIEITDFDDSGAVDENGEILVRFGGTLSTSGTGVVNYESTPYSAIIQFTINN